MKKSYHFDKATGIATCLIQIDNKTISGTAKCHEHDKDFMAEYTGLYIAETRADIHLMQHIRDNKLKPQLSILNHLESVLTDAKSRRTVRRNIQTIKKQVTTINDAIATANKNVCEYIDAKEKLYQQIRAKRTKEVEKTQQSNLTEAKASKKTKRTKSHNPAKQKNK